VAGASQVLLKNSGKTLPLDPAKTKKIAVVGPLENTLYTDWYSGNLPYKVTPREGITERLGSGATVNASEGVDRIALKDVNTGKYITAGSGAGGAVLGVSATSPDTTTQFDAFDWGQGVLTLRSAANDKYVGFNWANFVNDQAQPTGWFVMQQFKLEQQADGNYLLRYAGYETSASWWINPGEGRPGPYVGVGADGTLRLSTKENAAVFAKETISSGVDNAVAAARGADAAVVVVGSMPFINGREAHDRTSMALAEGQSALIKAVKAANPNTIVVVENSYPTTLTWEQENIPAILWTTHAGAETGHAIADVLFGDVNPAGRLTQTWYRSDSDLPDIRDYDIIKSDRTYLYFKGAPLYPFGHGLSYSTFAYSGLRPSARSVGGNGTVTVSVDVTNTGAVAGDEVVQLYTHQRASRVKQPVKQLRAFQRVSLQPGQTKTVRLTLRAADLAHWDVTRNKWVVETSAHDLLVGSSSADIRQRATLGVRGETVPARDLTKTTRAVDFDDYSGVRFVDESKVRGDAIGATNSGQWVKFADVALGSGARTFSARTAKATTGSGTIQIRLDSPTGRLAGTAPVASTGDIYAYATTTAALSGATGRHDVYLVFSGDLRISTFSLK
jgi:beta-glucosidase